MKKIIFIFLLICVFCFTMINTDSIHIIDINDNSSIPIIHQDVSNQYDKSVYDSYSDVVGKIIIEGTNINSYVTKTIDNSYYLTHNYQKMEDKFGNVFIDYRNHLDDKKILIYGHNSKDYELAPFKDLENYKDYDFYSKHKDITFILNNLQYTYRIFSVIVTKEGDYSHTKIKFNDQEYMEHLNGLVQNSLYKIDEEIKIDDHIIMLQTCYYDPLNTYLLVSAKREINEKNIY